MKKLIVIGFSGKAFAGKSTYSNKLRELILQELPGIKADIIPLAKTLKDQARMLGWNGKKDEDGRRLLQELSWPIKHYHGEDCYAKWCVEEAMKEELDVLIVDDVRMMPEVEYIFRSPKFDASLFRIERPNVDTVSKLTTDQKNDISETQLDDYPFDAVIINDGGKKQVEKAWLNIIQLIKNKLAVQNAQTSIIGLSSLIQHPEVIHANI